MRPHHVKSRLALAIGAAITFPQVVFATTLCTPATDNKITEIVIEEEMMAYAVGSNAENSNSKDYMLAEDSVPVSLIIKGACFGIYSNVQQVLLGLNMNGDMVPLVTTPTWRSPEKTG